MSPPSSEEDLKRRARRRLIGAVALTLLAVVVLPLLLEDEPPPAGPLAVRMEASPPVSATANEPETVSASVAGIAAPQTATAGPPAPTVAEVATRKPESSQTPAAPTPTTQTSEAAPERPRPRSVAPATAAAPAGPEASPAATGERFVVQLAALSDSRRAGELRSRAAKTGLPAYTDRVGSLTRVRVGPYASREEAVAAAVKLAESGLPGQVLVK